MKRGLQPWGTLGKGFGVTESLGICLSHCCIAGKRHHDHCHSYEGQHLTAADLQVQSINTMAEAWWHAGRRGAGEGTESSTSGSTCSRKRDGHSCLEPLRPSGITSSSKAAPANGATPYGPVGAIFIQTTTARNRCSGNGGSYRVSQAQPPHSDPLPALTGLSLPDSTGQDRQTGIRNLTVLGAEARALPVQGFTDTGWRWL